MRVTPTKDHKSPDLKAIKILKYEPPLKIGITKSVQPERYFTRKRNNKTSFQRRKAPSIQNDLLNISPRKAVSNTSSKLSQYLSVQINLLHNPQSQQKDKGDGKINELKRLMTERNKRIDYSPLKDLHHYNQFKEFKMEEVMMPESNVIHSRNKKNCPFTKSYKARKLMSKSQDSKLENKQSDYDSLSVNNNSKYIASRRMVLTGTTSQLKHKIDKNFNFIAQKSRDAQQTMEMLRIVQTVKRRERKNIRQQYIQKTIGKNLHLKDDMNECKPWDNEKIDQMEEFQNMTE